MRGENSVYRIIVEAPSHSQEAALKGEIGAASMLAILLKGQLKHLKYSMKEECTVYLRHLVEVTEDVKKTDE